MRTGQPMCSQEVALAQGAALQQAIEVPLQYLQAGTNLATAALAGARRYEAYRHYPRSDVVAQAQRTRFFYHGHASSCTPRQEHGHFHLFVEHADGITPAYSHLVALALDQHGLPLRWFTTNRWVTGERWCAAPSLQAQLPQLHWHSRGRLAPVARWLSAMVQLFQGEITELLQQRDAALATIDGGLSLEQRFELRSVDVLSACDASLANRLAGAELAAA